MDNIIENWNVVEILFGLLCNYLFNINKMDDFCVYNQLQRYNKCMYCFGINSDLFFKLCVIVDLIECILNYFILGINVCMIL